MTPAVFNKHVPGYPPDAVWIMRPSIWGNPYRSGRDGTREEVISSFRRYILNSPLRLRLPELRGKNLLCCCKPRACHGDVLLELANA